MFEWIQDIDDYEDRKVDRTEIPGFVISTAITSDEGYETAVLDNTSAYPVERYEDKDEAIKGHKRWVDKMSASPPKTITRLGAWDGMISDEDFELEPIPDGSVVPGWM